MTYFVEVTLTALIQVTIARFIWLGGHPTTLSVQLGSLNL
jgi:hypothetical protein